MPKETREYFVTRVDVISAETKLLCRDPDRDIAQATFHANVMDPNIQVPTPILLEQLYTAEDGRKTLTLLQTTVLFPPPTAKEWQDHKVIEPEYRIVVEALKDLCNVLHGYNEFGQQTLDEDNQEIIQEEDEGD